MILQPCGRCRRHVREATCPFCGASVDHKGARAPLLGRLGRAAIFAGVSACYTNSNTPPATTPIDTTTHTTDQQHGVAHHDTADAGDALAQPPAGLATVGGVIKDQATRLPMQGATIQLIPRSGGAPQATTSDANGWYQFTNVEPGMYTMTFQPSQSNPRMAPRPEPIAIKADAIQRVERSLQQFDVSNTPMPYGAPPMRRRVV